jgi:hypothetical protein
VPRPPGPLCPGVDGAEVPVKEGFRKQESGFRNGKQLSLAEAAKKKAILSLKQGR